MRINRGHDFRVDHNMVPIPGGQIVEIFNIAVTAGEWTVVQLGSELGVGSKSLLAKLRSGNSWKLSHLEAGTRYITIPREVAIDLVGDRNEVLFYAQTSSGNDTLEVMILD